MRNHVIAEVVNLAKKDDRIMLVTADLGFNVVEKFSDQYPDRYVNVGIAEQNMTAVSAGLALEGNMVFTYSIGNFPTLRCIEQIRNLVCYHNANVKVLAVGGGFAYGTLGMTHHATEDIAMMRALPNMRVYVPADAVEAVACLHDLYQYDGPAYLRMARGREANMHDESEILDVTKPIPVKENGSDIVILSSGTILAEALKLQNMLTETGIPSSAYSIPLIKPLDADKIAVLAKDAKLIISMEEHNVIGGLGGAVSEVLSGLSSHAPLRRFGLQDTFTAKVGSQDYLRKYYGIDAESIFQKIIAEMR